MKVQIQFSVLLPNRPGELSRLTRVLAKAKVNIEAIHVQGGHQIGIVSFIGSKPAAVRTALKKGKLSFSEEKVLAIEVPNQPGALAALASQLAAKRVNIVNVYGSTCAEGCDCQGVLVLAFDDLAAAKAVIAKM
jgi:hypothetical protein